MVEEQPGYKSESNLKSIQYGVNSYLLLVSKVKSHNSQKCWLVRHQYLHANELKSNSRCDWELLQCYSLSLSLALSLSLSHTHTHTQTDILASQLFSDINYWFQNIVTQQGNFCSETLNEKKLVCFLHFFFALYSETPGVWMSLRLCDAGSSTGRLSHPLKHTATAKVC